ncbi:hypothetical protein SLA2020_138990 [Shorea laevis]
MAAPEPAREDPAPAAGPGAGAEAGDPSICAETAAKSAITKAATKALSKLICAITNRSGTAERRDTDDRKARRWISS